MDAVTVKELMAEQLNVVRKSGTLCRFRLGD